MTLENRLNMMTIGVLQGKEHLETIYGDFNENMEQVDVNSKEFMFGHITGMMEVLRVLIEGFEEE